jgi:hypothetical protein
MIDHFLGLHSPNTNSDSRSEVAFASTDVGEILEQTYNPQKIYETAHESWLETYDFEKLRTAILFLIGETSSKDPVFKAHLKYISRQRKKGGKLMSAWRMVSSDHKNPKPLSKLIYHMGRLKDLRKKPELRHAAGKVLLSRLNSYEVSLETQEDFEPSTFESFYDKYLEILSPLRELSSKTTLSLEDHHEVRRQIRLLTHYFQLLSMSINDIRIIELADFFKSITWEMGRTQSHFTKKSIKGDLDLGVDTTTINETIYQKIKILLQQSISNPN